jgi:hypothetical protein
VLRHRDEYRPGKRGLDALARKVPFRHGPVEGKTENPGDSPAPLMPVEHAPDMKRNYPDQLPGITPPRVLCRRILAC